MTVEPTHQIGGGPVEAPQLRRLLTELYRCSDAAADAIAARARERRYAARSVIVSYGEASEETFLLIAGRAHAFIFGAEGQMALVRELAAGDLFGLLGADQAGDEPEVVAIEASAAALFRAMDFLDLMETHACLGVAVTRNLLRQLRAATERLAASATLSAAGRVHAELLRLARAGDGRAIRPVPVLAALAVRLNSTRETVSRTISALERRGLIRREHDALVLVSPSRIEELVI